MGQTTNKALQEETIIWRNIYDKKKSSLTAERFAIREEQKWKEDIRANDKLDVRPWSKLRIKLAKYCLWIRDLVCSLLTWETLKNNDIKCHYVIDSHAQILCYIIYLLKTLSRIQPWIIIALESMKNI